MENIFFDSWQSVFRTLIITILAYLAMIFLLRASGKRTLSKMNAFDFIITVALGSALANVVLNKNVALVDGVIGFFLLMFLQFVITWLSVRSKRIKNLITSQPALLVYKGEMLEKTIKTERVTWQEINVAIRKKGLAKIGDVEIIVLETTGDLTVVPKIKGSVSEILKDVSSNL